MVTPSVKGSELGSRRDDVTSKSDHAMRKWDDGGSSRVDEGSVAASASKKALLPPEVGETIVGSTQPSAPSVADKVR